MMDDVWVKEANCVECGKTLNPNKEGIMWKGVLYHSKCFHKTHSPYKGPYKPDDE